MLEDLTNYLKQIKAFLNSDTISSLTDEEKGYSDNEDANKLIFSTPFAFITGLIFDQSIKSTLAWKAPFLLKERLGHLDPEKIALISIEDMTSTITADGYSLHRYPSSMAKNLIKSSQIVLDSFDGEANNIWDSLHSYKDVKKNLLKLSGVGEKKANLAVLMLARDFNQQFEDINDLPLAIDVHLKRVLERSGFFFNTEDKNTNLTEVEEAFKKEFSDFHALAGTPLWYIGQNFCHANNPECRPCPLSSGCKKKDVELGLF